MLTFAKNTIGYVISYLLLMLPTYILPYFGSNSALLNAMYGAMRGSWLPLPTWWMHVWCLVALIVLNWLRGNVVQKKYLAVFPFIAAFFDMTPGLSSIPLVPTILHLIGLVLGAMGVAAAVQDEGFESKLQAQGTKGAIGIGLITLAALLGSIFSMTGIFKKPKPAVVAPAASAPAVPKTVAPAALAAPIEKTIVEKPKHTPVAKRNANVSKPVLSSTDAQTSNQKSTQLAPPKPEVKYININN